MDSNSYSSLINLQLKRFPIDEMDINAKIAVIGKPGTGKSTLIEDIMFHHRYIPMGIVMVGTEEGVEQFQRIIPDSYIYAEYNQEAVNKLVARQKTGKRKKLKNLDAFLVIDDCMDDKKWLKNNMTRGIFKNGRHWSLLFIIAMQYCMDINPELRTCLDYIFILRENIPENRIKIYKHYCGIFPTYEMFEEVMKACTENYECLVIKNRCISNKIEDVVFWYKADMHDSFKMGGKSYWGYHNNFYNEHYESDEDSALMSSVNKSSLSFKGKKKGRLVIEKFH